MQRKMFATRNPRDAAENPIFRLVFGHSCTRRVFITSDLSPPATRPSSLMVVEPRMFHVYASSSSPQESPLMSTHDPLSLSLGTRALLESIHAPLCVHASHPCALVMHATLSHVYRDPSTHASRRVSPSHMSISKHPLCMYTIIPHA